MITPVYFATAEGYRVLRFWNNEVLDNPEGVRAAIADALHQGSPLNSTGRSHPY